MFRYLFVFAAFFGLLAAKEASLDSVSEVETLTKMEMTSLTKVDEDMQFVTLPSSSLKVGEVGLVIRELENYQVLVSSLEIASIDGASARAKVIPFKQLKQPYLPTPRLNPKEGDKVIFRSYNNKAFLIAPDEDSYQAIKNQYPFMDFVSSDLLMGFLNSRGKHEPNAKTLPMACSDYAVGLVFIVASKGLSVLSCENLATLHRQELSLPADIIPSSPFYTRVNFDGGGSLTYIFASKKSKKDYFGYYDSLIDGLPPKKAKKK